MRRTDLTTYTVSTTLLDKERYGKLIYSITMYFPYHHSIKLIDDTELIIKIDLDYWDEDLDDLFDQYQEEGMIGEWSVSHA